MTARTTSAQSRRARTCWSTPATLLPRTSPSSAMSRPSCSSARRAPDTDFTVKLVDVAPDGTAWNIADTIQRMRYREGDDKQVFMKPGEFYRITPPAMLVANVFLKGHRVRIEVSSSNFPSYARNLNTANDPYTSTGRRRAEHRCAWCGKAVEDRPACREP